MGKPLNLIVGVANILVSAGGGRFAVPNFIVGFACLLLFFGAFGPYED